MKDDGQDKKCKGANWVEMRAMAGVQESASRKHQMRTKMTWGDVKLNLRSSELKRKFVMRRTHMFEDSVLG